MYYYFYYVPNLPTENIYPKVLIEKINNDENSIVFDFTDEMEYNNFITIFYKFCIEKLSHIDNPNNFLDWILTKKVFNKEQTPTMIEIKSKNLGEINTFFKSETGEEFNINNINDYSDENILTFQFDENFLKMYEINIIDDNYVLGFELRNKEII